MPKVSAAKKIGQSTYGDAKVPVELYELSAKTKDDSGKVTEFTYTFPKFPEGTDVETLVKGLEYKDSKGNVFSGLSVLLDYVNVAIKNAARSSKLAEINGVLALRNDPEAAIKTMIDNMVIGFGVDRAVAEANVHALIASGAVKVPETAAAGESK